MKFKRETKKETKKQQFNRMEKFVLEQSQLDNDKIKIQFLKNQNTSILVSNIVDPCNFQIQLEENRLELEELMCELEKVYCGFGASIYDMTIEDLVKDRLCAATFYQDKNWHRCRIVNFDQALKKVKVFYIDYGGYDHVDLNNVKFLDKKFTKWPIYILNAKCHNIKKPSNIVWNENTIKYMLLKVQGVYLTVKIMGTVSEKNLELFSLDILHKTKSNKSLNQRIKIFTLNNQLIKDGHGEFFDEKTLNTFIDYETLIRIYFAQEYETFTKNTVLSSSNSYNEIENNVDTISFSNISDDLDANQKTTGRMVESLDTLRLKKSNLVEKVEFYEGSLKVILFKIENNSYIHCSHAAAILKINQENFFNLLDCSNLKRNDFFKKFNKKDQINSSLFELYYEIFKEEPTTIMLFAYSKLEILIDLQTEKLKKSLSLKIPVEREEILKGDFINVDEIVQFNAEILDEMRKNYTIYLEEFEKSMKPPLTPLENVKFKSDYRSFILDEVYFILGQIEVLDKRIRDKFITPANKKWLQCRRKLLGRKFDCLYQFLGKF